MEGWGGWGLECVYVYIHFSLRCTYISRNGIRARLGGCPCLVLGSFGFHRNNFGKTFSYLHHAHRYHDDCIIKSLVLSLETS